MIECGCGEVKQKQIPKPLIYITIWSHNANAGLIHTLKHFEILYRSHAANAPNTLW